MSNTDQCLLGWVTPMPGMTLQCKHAVLALYIMQDMAAIGELMTEEMSTKSNFCNFVDKK